MNSYHLKIMRRLFFKFTRKIDDCCDPLFESFGINCKGCDLTKYYPWSILMIILFYYVAITYFVWSFMIPRNFHDLRPK